MKAKQKSLNRLTTVTPVSKALAMFLFIVLPFMGFFMGKTYQEELDGTVERGNPMMQDQINNQDTSNSNFDQPDAKVSITPTNTMLQILSPKTGETLCLGKSYTVRWQVPAGMDGITLKIAEAKNGNTIHDIGNFGANYGGTQSGQGTFSWNVGFNRDGANLIPGPGYHIILTGTYKQYQLTNTSNYFTLSSC